MDEHEWLHNLHERLAVFALIFAGITATIVGMRNMIRFTGKYATKQALADQETKGRKELEACNVAVQSQVKDLDGKFTSLEKENSTKHEDLARDLGEVSGKLDVLIARDG